MPPGDSLRVLPFEKLLFADGVLAIGAHRLPWPHPSFTSYGPASSFLFVFPRTSTLIEHAGREPFVGSPAVATLYNRGQEYRRVKISEEGDLCDWFAVGEKTLRELVAHVDPVAADSAWPLRVRWVPVDARTYLRQRAVFEHVERSARPDRLFVHETMLDLFGGLLRRSDANAPRSLTAAQHELARRAAALVGGDSGRNASLAEIARTCGCSPFHLARTFKRATGTSLHRYRLTLRLNRSLELLRDTDDDLTTVALELGFADHSHFTLAFRRRFGITPSQFRVTPRNFVIARPARVS